MMVTIRRRPALDAFLALLVGSSLSGCILFVAGMSNQGPSGDELTQLQHETDPYRHGGNAAIEGQVTLDTPAGEMIAAAGQEVLVSPVTTYTSQRFDEYVLKKNEVPSRVDAQLYYSARTDASGRFRFAGLAPGDWFVVAECFWATPGSTAESKPELAYARVHVEPGETVETTVTRDVRNEAR